MVEKFTEDAVLWILLVAFSAEENIFIIHTQQA